MRTRHYKIKAKNIHKAQKKAREDASKEGRVVEDVYWLRGIPRNKEGLRTYQVITHLRQLNCLKV